MTDLHYASALLYPTLKLVVDCVDELSHFRKKQILVDAFKNLGLEAGSPAAKPPGVRSGSKSESSGDDFHTELSQAFVLKNAQRTEVQEQASNISEEVERYLKENTNKKPKDFFEQNETAGYQQPLPPLSQIFQLQGLWLEKYRRSLDLSSLNQEFFCVRNAELLRKIRSLEDEETEKEAEKDAQKTQYCGKFYTEFYRRTDTLTVRLTTG